MNVYINEVLKSRRLLNRVCKLHIYYALAGLPGFARDHYSIIMSISAFYFILNDFNLFSLETVAFSRLL